MQEIAKNMSVIALMVSILASSVAADAIGNFIRMSDDDGAQLINVYTENGLLYCTREADGFEMCHGLVQQADGTWKGRTMKHPDMPRFMTFNGTATFGPGAMSLKGCALGICDAEVWTVQ